MVTDNARAAEALDPTLSVFRSIDGLRLERVREVGEEGSVDRLILDFNTSSLVITADEDDDSIACKIEKASDPGCGVNVSGGEPWKNFIGSRFGWGWVTINQQGYCDGLLLSFDGIAPQLVLNVMASSIKIGVIVRNSA